jgi:four helix bundle protein
MPYRSHKELIVWQKAMRLAVASYAVARGLPAIERFGLAAQIRQAAASIPANIAEGNGRRKRGDYARSLAYARGSARELDTHLELAVLCGLTTETVVQEAKSLADEVMAMLTVMLRKLDPL